MNNSLINPVWTSLCETHKSFSLNYDGVKFYDPEVCSFGAFTENANITHAVNEYSKLTNSFFLVSENKTPNFTSNKIVLDKKIEGCQLVLDVLPKITISEEIKPLTEEYKQEIHDLIWLVMPGYYKLRTFEMGKYFGIFKDNKLVAITGQRMQTDSWIEVSAVVTHPEHTRKGYAKQLTAFVTNEIIKEGKHPILHTNKGNPAIRLYESLGFKLTRDMNWWYYIKK